MSRWEGILIDTEESIQAVRLVIEEVIGASFTHDGEGELISSFGRTAGAWLRDADFDDEPGLPFSAYRYALMIRDTDHAGTHHYASQEDAARRIYDTLVTTTSWQLWLLFDDMQLPVAHRNTHTAA